MGIFDLKEMLGSELISKLVTYKAYTADPVIYISGPMSNQPEFGRPVFKAVEDCLKISGFRVLNPAWFPLGLSYEQYMSMCLPMVAACDAMLMLPNWEKSQGATAEKAYAEALKKVVLF